jgi:hypothetical protein
MPELIGQSDQFYLMQATRGVLKDAITAEGTDYGPITYVTEDSAQTVRMSYANAMFPLEAFSGQVTRIPMGISETSLTAAHYAGGMFIPSDSIIFDQTGQVNVASLTNRIMGNMPGMVETVQAEIASAVWAQVFAGDSYDDWMDDNSTGTYTFDDVHSWAPWGTYTTAQDNMGSTAFADAELAIAVGNMKKYKGPFGKPMRMTPTHLLIPPELEMAARKLLTPAPGDFSGTRIWTTAPLDIIVVPEWTDDDTWMICDAGKASMKPVTLHLPNTTPSGLPNPRAVIEYDKDADGWTVDLHVYYKVGLGPWFMWYAEMVS